VAREGLDISRLLPLACEWAEQQAAEIRRLGRSLTRAEEDLAAAVGVRGMELVRITEVDEIPTPAHPALRAVCEKLQFLGDDTAGLTLGYGVVLRGGLSHDRRLLAHELRHVAQYEQRGSIAAYLAEYLPDLLRYGYRDAPLERDAREAERVAGGDSVDA
jgi:hypothetical protein